MGGKLTMSDDSHGIDHVGTNYTRSIKYIESLGVTNLYTLQRQASSTEVSGKAVVGIRSVALSFVKESFRE